MAFPPPPSSVSSLAHFVFPEPDHTLIHLPPTSTNISRGNDAYFVNAHPHNFPMMKRSTSFSGGGGGVADNDPGVLHPSQRDFQDSQLHGDHDAADALSEDDIEGGSAQLGERKKRLSTEQVKALERSFEVGNKLEPERKVQLARALDLQPRQIAIWFQNRRARWKTKQLERDYEVLKKQFDALKADNDALHAQNEKLHAELMALKGGDKDEAPKREMEGSYWSNGSENSCDVNLDMSRITSVMNGSVSSSQQLSSKALHHFVASMRPMAVTMSAQLPLHGTARPSDQQCFEIEQSARDESFCNMLGSIEDQQAFWPWTQQQHLFNN